MRIIVWCLSFLFAGLWSGQAQQELASDPSAWDNSIVTIETTRKRYDYTQPWNTRTSRTLKTGIVVGAREILTTADDLFDHILVRLQKGGRGRWTSGELAWVDYPANLAIVTTSEDAFWSDLKPVTLGSASAPNTTLQVLRWREGKLENRTAEFTQYTVRAGQLASINHVQLEASSEIQGVGRGEPIVANSHIVGIITQQEGRTCVATPASFVQSILDARKQGEFPGLGFFHFYWQPARNLASLAHLKLPGEPRGVLVIDVPPRPDGVAPVFKRFDIILQIDGFDADIEGSYRDPEFGLIMIENLAARQKWAGDEVRFKIWRDGQEMDITYRLPKFDYDNSLLPDATYNQEPEYLIVGGLVFQPLTDSFLQSWGADWQRRAPFRLNYYNNQSKTEERPGLVILSQVLPDEYNIGYQNLSYLVVDTVNGQRISQLSDLRNALENPVDGFHVIEFMRSNTLRKIVLAAGEAEQRATARVLQWAGIPKAYNLASGTAVDGAASLLDAIQRSTLERIRGRAE